MAIRTVAGVKVDDALGASVGAVGGYLDGA
jgi:hypothetical protein